MCLKTNASMEEVYKAEVECLRKQLAEKDKEIKRLQHVIDNCDKEAEERIDDKTEILHEIIRSKVDPFLALVQLCANKQLQDKAEEIRCEYEPFVKWESARL